MSARRIVLLGKTGVGKSAAGNTILGQRVFKSVMRMISVTNKCSDAHVTISGRSVSVVDTPGFFDTEMNTEELAMDIARSVYFSSPGPHAFLTVFPVNMKFTKQEEQIPQKIKNIFGQGVLKYSIILFTHGDQLEEEPIENLIEENSRLRRLVDQCGGRFHVFNNRDQNSKQVNDLLQKIDSMIEQNGGGHYSNQMFEDAQRLKEEEEKRRRSEEERKQQEKQRQLEMSKEIEKITEEIEAKHSELERLKAEKLGEEENNKQKEKKQRLERIISEMEAQKFKVKSLEAKRQREEEKRKQEEKQIRAEKTKCSGYEAFYTKYRHYFVAAAVGAVIAAPLTAGAAGVAAASGAVLAAAKGFVVGVVGGAAFGVAVEAAAEADHTQSSQRDKQRKKQK